MEIFYLKDAAIYKFLGLGVVPSVLPYVRKTIAPVPPKRDR
jgi:hypothetical protein